MAEVGDEPVRDVDHRAREADEPSAEQQPWPWQKVAVDELCTLVCRKRRQTAAHSAQTQGRIAQRAREVDDIALARARAAQRATLRHFAEGGNGERERPLGGDAIATDQDSAEGPLIVAQSHNEFLYPRIVHGLRPGGG